jgi:hypothetical protein
MSTKCEKLAARIGKMVSDAENSGEISSEEAMIANCTYLAATKSMYNPEENKLVKPEVDIFKTFIENMRLFNPM